MTKASSAPWTTKAKYGVGLCAVALTASLSLNVTLLDRLTLRPRQSEVVAGDRLPLLHVAALDGEEATLSFERRTFVYLFSPTCDWCWRDYENLVALSAAVKGRFPVIGLAINGTRGQLESYLGARPFPGAVWVMARPTDLDLAAKLGSTPQLLVVDRGGGVRKAWGGALFDQRKLEVEAFIGSGLPGVLPPMSFEKRLKPGL